MWDTSPALPCRASSLQWSTSLQLSWTWPPTSSSQSQVRFIWSYEGPLLIEAPVENNNNNFSIIDIINICYWQSTKFCKQPPYVLKACCKVHQSLHQHPSPPQTIKGAAAVGLKPLKSSCPHLTSLTCNVFQRALLLAFYVTGSKREDRNVNSHHTNHGWGRLHMFATISHNTASVMSLQWCVKLLK